jgi:hypothetical protein
MIAGVLAFMGWIVFLLLVLGIIIGVGVSNRRR